MNKRIISLLVACIIVLLGIIVYLLVDQGHPGQPHAEQFANASISSTPSQELSQSNVQQLPTPAQLSPEEVVKIFYTRYLLSQVSPYKTGSYKTNKALSNEFKQNIAKMVPGDENNDPILCYRNKTTNVTFDQAIYSPEGNRSQVIIHRSSDDRKIYRIALVNTNGQWIINDTFCIPIPN